MTPAPVYDLGGLRVRSPLPLGAPRCPGPGFDVDVLVEAPIAVPFERPSPDVVAERREGSTVYYTFCRVPGGVTARFFGLGEFFIADSMDMVVCRSAVGMPTEYLSILLSGTVAAFLHSARGRIVLHASAVSLGSDGLAFMGRSGQGKSTTAATLCAAGAALLTDDVLVVETGPDHSVLGRRGGSELRLRPGADVLAGRFPTRTARYPTVDGRTALLAPTAADALLPLAAIVTPCPSPGATGVRARRLPMGEAALCLGANHRIDGWREPEMLRRNFQATAEIASLVPVLELTVPWGPPFQANAAEIIAACRSACEMAMQPTP